MAEALGGAGGWADVGKLVGGGEDRVSEGENGRLRHQNLEDNYQSGWYHEKRKARRARWGRPGNLGGGIGGE